MEDIANLVAAVMPVLNTAVAACGRDVLTHTEDAVADGAARLGLRVLAALRGVRRTRGQLDEALTQLASDPGSPTSYDAVATAVRDALLADRELGVRLRDLLAGARPVVIASGERSVAALENRGIISTGDNAQLRGS